MSFLTTDTRRVHASYPRRVVWFLLVSSILAHAAIVAGVSILVSGISLRAQSNSIQSDIEVLRKQMNDAVDESYRLKTMLKTCSDTCVKAFQPKPKWAQEAVGGE